MITGKIIIGSRNKSFVDEMSNALAKIAFKADIVSVDSKSELINEVLNYKSVLLFCDKFFLGMNPKEKMTMLRAVNGGIKFVICDYNTQQQILAYRLYKMGVDGFINDIGDKSCLDSSIREFFNKGKFYPQSIKSDIHSGRYLDYPELLGDITSSEFDVAVKRFSGLTSKEIGGKHTNKIDIKFYRFKKKAGILGFKDALGFMESLKKGDFI